MEYLDGFLLEKVITSVLCYGTEEGRWGAETAKHAIRLGCVCASWRSVVREILNSRNMGTVRQAIRSAGELEAVRFLCSLSSPWNVDLSGSVFKQTDLLWGLLIQRCENLESLDLSFGSVEEEDLVRCLKHMAEVGFPKITRLRMAHAPATAGYGHWIMFTPYLEELDVSFCHKFNPLGFFQGQRTYSWFEMAQNLRKLSLTGCERFRLSVWWTPSSVEFPKLEVLDLAYVDAATDENLRTLITTCTPHLQHVSLTRNSYNNYNVGGYVSESTVIYLRSRNIKVSFVS